MKVHVLELQETITVSAVYFEHNLKVVKINSRKAVCNHTVEQVVDVPRHHRELMGSCADRRSLQDGASLESDRSPAAEHEFVERIF